ncbi:MAG: hypothetical protein Q7U47_01560 [Paludibacter sp.]|nr:hypothetical protein [Paludibacter sp.]
MMLSTRSDVSHQVLSMKILCKLSEKEPGFIPEIMAYLENIDSNEFTSGFNTTKNKIIKHLKNKSLKM